VRKKTGGAARSPFHHLNNRRRPNQPAVIASLGQASTHAPQSLQVVASTTATLSVIAMASNGQDATHASHPEHFSGSTTAAI
jgi:hypothetical protein